MTDVTAALPAPDGYVVDFDNPERRADVATYWCFGVGMSLAMLFTAQRVYVKLGIGTGWRLDDCKQPRMPLNQMFISSQRRLGTDFMLIQI